MSKHCVEFRDVRDRILEYGERATLVTVTPDGMPHVVTAVIEVDVARLRARIGPRTRANLAMLPQLTLTWAPRAAVSTN